MSKLSTAQLAIIKNAELLAFHQDSTVGGPAAPFKATANAPVTSPPEYYAGKSTKGTHVFIINTGSRTAKKTFSFANVPGLGSGKYTLHDMWTGLNVTGTFSGTYSVRVAAHDTAAFLIEAA
jgi:alpha-galactosidase